MKMSIINLKGETILGVHAAERKAKRPVKLDLEISYDAVIRDDDINETLNYEAIEKAILAVLAKQKFHLMESLAEHIAHLVLEMDRVQAITVQLSKPAALKSADTVVVEYQLKK